MNMEHHKTDIARLLSGGKISPEFKEILDCIKDGIFITDGTGKVLAMNQASLDLCPYSENELVGYTMSELIEKGYFEDSVANACIKQRKTVSFIQKSISGQYDLIATATPFFDDDGEITYVILTERDVTELLNLKNTVENLNEQLNQQMEYYRSKNILHSDLIYESEEMDKLMKMALRIADTDATMLIEGESGTGKSLLAKFIYKNSSRREKPFIDINCGAIPENLLESELFGYEKGAFTGASEKGKAGLFELANEGTLFLDEISTLPMQLQVKILRAIQEREIMRVGGSEYIPIDIRIISATNTPLAKAVREGNFRKDLYYRLNVCQLEIPPLRERKEDIYPLCEYFLAKFNAKYQTTKKIAASAWKIIRNYNWPGNIRELENMLERIIITTHSDLIFAENIAGFFSPADLKSIDHDNNSVINIKDEMEVFEKELLMSKAKYYKTATELADALCLDKSTVTRKMKKYGIQLSE